MTALKIFSGDDESQSWRRLLNLPPNAYLRLREYYERFMEPAPQRRKFSRSTPQAYLTSIGRWEQFGTSELKLWETDQFGRMMWKPLNSQTPQSVNDPPIGIVIDDDLVAFQNAMLDAGFPVSTVNTTRRHLLPIFNLAAPRSERGAGRGDLLVRPFCPILDEEVVQKLIPTEEEMTAFFKATSQAKWPISNDWPASHWWQALIVLLCNYGLGCADWKRLEWDEHVIENCSLLKYVRYKTRRKRKHPVLFEINATTRWYLNRIRSETMIRNGKSRIFCSAQSKTCFKNEWNRLVELAGVSCKEKKSDGKTYEEFSRHAIRRFCNQYMNDHAPGKPGEWLLNHAFTTDNVVNHRSYSRIYQPPQSVTDALHSVEQLPIFLQTMQEAA